jgi:hypothetical protein
MFHPLRDFCANSVKRGFAESLAATLRLVFANVLEAKAGIAAVERQAL